ncbi:mannose-1-phosphate guanylyltransferase/mannose-6-phosphate isomerase [Prochlorococcus sp. AH-736-F23]|nr:mannose-1-phosphate guanylyltransferase/mannose-6-phosphate isomerase [Prochlorococcus sp. AH-736-F23]
MKIIPLILCGGKGTRLWPLSRETYPKQFIALHGDSDRSLLQQTQERISDLEGIENPIIVCNEEHRFLVAEQMRNINITPKAIILETEGRNTAPAITLGAIRAYEEDKNSLLLVLSADHIIKDVSIFKKVLKEGFKNAQEGNLVTFGIIPNRPETGYGYIESLLPLDKEIIKGSRIKKFIEKPNIELAKKFISNAHYSWNSGMFIFKSKSILEELKLYSPKVFRQCQKAMENSTKDLDFIRIEKNSFIKAPNIPIDIAVMENTTKGVVLPLDAGWSDVGSWKSLWDSEKKDQYGNVIKGKVLDEKSENCYLHSENRLLVSIGLKNLIVVETPDVTLVAQKDLSDKLKSVVEKIKERGLKEGATHKKIYRPWGTYTSLIEGNEWLVKRIEVNPYAKLSLQMHKFRAEHWIVVSGKACVEIDNKSFTLKENQSTYIPLGSKHRLSNPYQSLLTIIEIQSGEYIGEDDIIRFKDNYGRVI